MKRKVLGILLTGLFIVGMIATVNINQTNQEKNIEILTNSKAKQAEGLEKPVNCLLGGTQPCPLWSDIPGPWYVVL